MSDQNVAPTTDASPAAATAAASSSSAKEPGGPQEAVAWSISFAPTRGKRGKGSKKEKDAIAQHNSTVSGDTSASDADAGGVASAAASSVDDQQGEEKKKKKKALDVVDLNEAQLVDESVLVPKNLTTTKEDIAARKYFDQNRWFCTSRPQYKRSCGISSVTSAWNTLYSKIGYGNLPPLSQEEAIEIVGFKPPFEDVRWGPFAGNIALCKWFYKINRARNVTGKAFIAWKPAGKHRTIGLTDQAAESMLKEGLRSSATAFVYHCKNHYMPLIGYEEQPVAPRLALLPKLSASETDTHFLIGDCSRGINPSIHVRKFSDICLDLHTEMPNTFNIRHPEKGVIPLKSKKVGGTIHCILGFRSDVAGDDAEFADDDEEKEEIDAEEPDPTDE